MKEIKNIWNKSDTEYKDCMISYIYEVSNREIHKRQKTELGVIRG